MRSSEFIELAKDCGSYAFDTEYNPDSSYYRDSFRILGCSFATRGMAYYTRDLDEIRTTLDVLFQTDLDAVAHNGKSDLQSLVASKIIPFGAYPKNFVDTMVAENLLDENIHVKHLGLKAIVFDRFQHKMTEFFDAWKYGPDSIEFEKYGEEDAYWEWRLWETQKPELERDGLMKIFRKVLMPSSHVFTDAELFGITWDTEFAHQLLKDFTFERDRLEKEIYSEIGYLNLNAPQQLAKRFFEELGWSDAGIKRTPKTNKHSIDDNAFQLLAPKHPVCEKILRYKKLTKLISTYVLPLTQRAIDDPKRRIHPSFWLVSTTGRTRCEDPNLQNVPSRTSEGKKIRQAFVAEPGWSLLICDYSQIELRLVACISGDRTMKHAYLHWLCTKCNSEGDSTTILHSCPICGEKENEKVLKGDIGFWHGLDLHQITTESISALGGDRGAGKCVDPRTLVVVDGKYQQIGEFCDERDTDRFIEVDNQIYVGSGKNERVSHFYTGKKQDSFLLIAKSAILKCSGDHRVLTVEGLKRAADISTEDVLILSDVPKIGDAPNPIVKINPFSSDFLSAPVADVELTPEWAYLAGVFIGDGCMSREGAVSVVSSEKREEDKQWSNIIADHIKGMGLPVSKTKIRENLTNYSIGSRRVSRFFEQCLDLHPKKGREISIPSWVFTNTHTAKAFVGGLFDTDGYIKGRASGGARRGTEISICTRSWVLASHLLTILRALGDEHCSVTLSFNKTYKKNYFVIKIGRPLFLSIVDSGYIKHPFKKNRADSIRQEKSRFVCSGKIQRVEKSEDASLVDVSVSSDTHLYFANGLTTHNTANFALVYMASGYTMNQYYPGLSVLKWGEAIDQFMKKYEGVHKWHVVLENDLVTKGVVRDLFGRKRRIPEYMRRTKHALNQFVNFAPQASACELSQLCMAKLREKWIDRGVWGKDIRIVNFVHDECVFECKTDLVDLYRPEIFSTMETSVQFPVPIRLDMKVSQNWNVK